MASQPKENLDRLRAHKLLDSYHGEVDDFFKLWPADKLYFFSRDKKAFLAYGISHKAAICMGDPVGPPDSIKFLLIQFKDYCDEKDLTMAFIQTNNKCRDAYKLIGLHNILIGSDAVIDIDHFLSQTIHNKYFRNLVNRKDKQKFEVSTYLPPHNKTLLNEIEVISNSWIKLPHRKEWSFLTGRFDNDYLQQVVLQVLRDEKGKAQAFVNEIPSYKPGVFTIDLMRHRSGAPANCMDFLFIDIIKTKRKEGFKSFNLGMSPIDGQKYVSNLADSLLLSTYKLSNSFIGFRGLHQFKAKYEPNWDPRYVWYQGSVLNLPRIGWAVYSLLRSKGDIK